ncbi:hypothetical protein [Halopiger aswanensis]|uniref:Uncharacterized protein n=1 Tax=Halopiger aswanensis TaxID=148449 RepID=A0A3R7FSN8_9EURY|nr:hypothetical protein [Halopiger aswanensis]RKD86224.1 hypothetical protein ATJ93_4641 [Halopiger aswanensis]
MIRSEDTGNVIEFEWSNNGVRYWQALCDRVFPYETRCAILDAIATADGLVMTNTALATQVSETLDREVTTQTLIGHLEVFEELGIVALLPRWDRNRDSVIKRVPYLEDWLANQEYQVGAPVAPLSLGARLMVEYLGWEYRPVSPSVDPILSPGDERSLLPLKGLLFANLLTVTGRVPLDERLDCDTRLLDAVGAMPTIELEVGSLEALSDTAYDQLAALDLGFEVPERGEEPPGDYWHNMAVVGRIAGFDYDDRERVPIGRTVARFSESWIAAPMELYPRQKADDPSPPGVDPEAIDGPDPELVAQRIPEAAVDARKTEFPTYGSAESWSRLGQDVAFGDDIVFGTFVRQRITPRERSIQYVEADGQGPEGQGGE